MMTIRVWDFIKFILQPITTNKMETDLLNQIKEKELELQSEILKNNKLEEDLLLSDEKIEKLKYQIEKLKEFAKSE